MRLLHDAPMLRAEVEYGRATVLVFDFGSQYTRLIARRIRERRVYCELLPPPDAAAAVAATCDARKHVGLMIHSEVVYTRQGMAAWCVARSTALFRGPLPPSVDLRRRNCGP